MAKYADITPFYEWLDWLEKESNTSCPEYETMMFYEIRDKLDTLPEVVRCKDCKHFNNTHIDRGGCELEKEAHGTSAVWYINDFCSYGERKEE